MDNAWVHNGLPPPANPIVHTEDELFGIAKSLFISRVDTDTDRLIQSVIGGRGSEYELAEKEATSFKSAGYTGTAPSSVTAWATAKGWTTAQSADSIISAATNWRTAQARLRSARLHSKELARLAADGVELDAVKAGWGILFDGIKESLNV